jgi:hypothetical protein
MHPYLIQLLAQEKQRDLLRQAAHNGSVMHAPASRVALRRWLHWRRRRPATAAQVIRLHLCGEISDKPVAVESAS